MKRIIIFGATGNAGSYVTKYATEYFAGKDYQIVASGRRSRADVFAKMGVEYYSVNITNDDDFSKLPQEDVYAVIQLAAPVPAYMEGYHPREYLNTIINGTYNVLEYCRKAKANRILFAFSTFDVWQYPSGTVIHIDTPKNYAYTGDHAVYIICKNTAVELIEHYRQQYGLRSFVFRIPTIYTYSTNHYIYRDGRKELRPMYKLIKNAMRGKPLEIWGDPNYAKDMLHVYDMAQMFCKAIEKEGESRSFYNCSTGVPVTQMEQMMAIRKVFCPVDKQSDIVVLSDKVAGGGNLLDVKEACEELGYSPKYDVVSLYRDFKEEMELDRFLELRGR